MKTENTFNSDPNIEARIVAWVLGEASPFEAAELERLVAENPELAVFKRRMEAVHGLIGNATREPVRQVPRLSPERRAKLLAVIGANPAAGSAVPVAMGRQPTRRAFRIPLWAYSVAACLVVGVLSLNVVHFGGMTRKPSRPDPVATAVELPIIAGDAEGPARYKQLEEHVAKAETQRVVAYEASAKARAERENRLRNSADAAYVSTGKAKAEREYSLRDPTMRVPQVTNGIGVSGYSGLSKADLSEADLSRNVAFSYVPAQQMDIAGAPAPAPQSPLASRFGDFSLSGNSSLPGNLPPSGPSGPTIGASVEDTASLALKDQVISMDAFSVSASQTGMEAGAPRMAAAGPPAKEARGVIPANRAGAVTLGVQLNQKAVGAPPLAAKAPPLTPAALDAPVMRAQSSFPGAARTEVAADAQPISTFSLHVSDVSFGVARAALARGQRPDASSIRPEEFYNAFDYGDPAPVAGEPVGCRIEQSAHPFLQQRNLLRISMKVPAMGRNTGQPLHLTVLVDTSGSMEREDRIATLRAALAALAKLLGPNDSVTLIGFARQPRLIADRLRGNEAANLANLIGRTPAEGGTNLEEALKLAGEKARAQYVATAQNRIVVLTDGAANLGSDDPARLAEQVDAFRQSGIAFDACGIGADGLDDTVLEALTRKGDGRYYLLNSPDDADAGFAAKLAGAFRPAAENVKLQVRFNPARVQSYRLIGFEKHRLRTEDFRNDRVDAAELAADEAGVALYQIELKPQGEGEIGDVFVRFRKATGGEMVERSWTISHQPQPAPFDKATASMQLAGTAALLAEKLQGGAPAGQIRLEELATAVNHLRLAYPQNARVQELVTMYSQARRMLGE